jgi:hypothetical protein
MVEKARYLQSNLPGSLGYAGFPTGAAMRPRNAGHISVWPPLLSPQLFC